MHVLKVVLKVQCITYTSNRFINNKADKFQICKGNMQTRVDICTARAMMYKYIIMRS